MSLLERVYFFHGELIKNRYPNASTLVNEFEISPSTARRDIAYLRDRLLAPLEYDSRRQGFYYTETNFGLPFENSSKITLLLGVLEKLAEEAGLGQTTEIKQVKQKLASMLSPEYQKVIDAIACEWIEIEEINTAIFETVIDGIITNKLIEIEYRSPKAQTSVRKIEPVKLLNYQGKWYLLAYCRLRKAIRIFHLSRIGSTRLLPEKLTQPRKLSDSFLKQSFGIFLGDTRYHAKILFTGTAAELVRQQYWHKKQKIQKTEDGIILTLPISDDREIMMKVLQYGAQAKVIEPESLRTRIRQEIDKMQQVNNE